MKKIAFIIAVCLFSLSSKAQVSNNIDSLTSRVSKGGYYLEKFGRQATFGLGMQLIGGIAIAGAGASTGGSRKPLYIAGGALAAIGFFVTLTSYGHIRNSALSFQGNSLIYTIPKKK